MVVQQQQELLINEFVESIPEAPVEIAQYEMLRRDFHASPPPVVDMEALATGEMFGILTVPSWQDQVGVWNEAIRNRISVAQGGSTPAQTNRILDTGAAAHYTETAGPGEIGNFALSAHRRSFGDNFLHLPRLAAGDWVLLETSDTWYIYQVFGEGRAILPTDIYVVYPDPFSPVDDAGRQQPTRRLMTLTTCTTADGGAFGNSHRWVVHAELYAWMPRASGIPPMIDHYWNIDAAAETQG
jgi:sortase A